MNFIGDPPIAMVNRSWSFRQCRIRQLPRKISGCRNARAAFDQWQFTTHEEHIMIDILLAGHAARMTEGHRLSGHETELSGTRRCPLAERAAALFHRFRRIPDPSTGKLHLPDMPSSVSPI
ncbi:MAG: hypothetical protein WAU86_07375 [Oricola sp.]